MHAQVMAAVLAFSGLVGTPGNGKLTQEERDVGDFQALSVGAGIHGTVTVGPQSSVRLEGDENLLPLVQTRVAHGKLFVFALEPLRPTKPIRLTVVVRRLDEVVARGGSRLEAMPGKGSKLLAEAIGGSELRIKGMDVDALDVRSSGGAKVQLFGTARHLAADSSGGSSVAAYDLPVESARVDGSGGARMELSVSNEIAGRASGGASIQLKGMPAKRWVSTSGGGKLLFN